MRTPPNSVDALPTAPGKNAHAGSIRCPCPRARDGDFVAPKGPIHKELSMVDTKNEIRCGQCGRLLMKGEVVNVAIKCPRCKTINQISGKKTA